MSKNICQNSVKQKIPYPKRDSKKENKKRKYYIILMDLQFHLPLLIDDTALEGCATNS